MTINSRPRKLFYDNDDPEISKLIHHLLSLKYFINRTTQFHIKIGPVNFFPTTGTITIDGEGPSTDKGQESLLSLLAQKYPPRKTNAYVRRPASTPSPTLPQQAAPLDQNAEVVYDSFHVDDPDQKDDFGEPLL
jgi:hypothetical protein